jgi:hypothetical protein
MTPQEIEGALVKLKKQLNEIAPLVPSGFMYAKYRKTENELKQIFNDLIVLVRELATSKGNDK